MVKHLPAMQEIWVRSLGWEELLEKETATHSSYSCLKNPMDRGIWQAAVLRITKSWTLLKQLSMHAKSIAAGHPLNIGGTH